MNFHRRQFQIFMHFLDFFSQKVKIPAEIRQSLIYIFFKFRMKNLQTNFNRRQFPDPQFQMQRGAKSELVCFLTLKKIKL